MINPTDFLLQKIINSDKSNLKTLGQLHAKYVDDISEVIREFAEQTVIDTLARLKKGDVININGIAYSAQKKIR